MAAKAKYFLNNIQTQSLPKEYKSLSLSVNWNREAPLNVDVDIDNVTFYGDEAQQIIDFFNTYGFGVLMPFGIQINGVNATFRIKRTQKL